MKYEGVEGKNYYLVSAEVPHGYVLAPLLWNIMYSDGVCPSVKKSKNN